MAVALEEMWGDVSLGDEAIDPMRQVNPEWDFMGRTFFILGEANLALRVPGRKAICLRSIDALINDTLPMESRHGMEQVRRDRASGLQRTSSKSSMIHSPEASIAWPGPASGDHCSVSATQRNGQTCRSLRSMSILGSSSR